MSPFSISSECWVLIFKNWFWGTLAYLNSVFFRFAVDGLLTWFLCCSWFWDAGDNYLPCVWYELLGLGRFLICFYNAILSWSLFSAKKLISLKSLSLESEVMFLPARPLEDSRETFLFLNIKSLFRNILSDGWAIDILSKLMIPFSNCSLILIEDKSSLKLLLWALVGLKADGDLIWFIYWLIKLAPLSNDSYLLKML